jgi:DNA polymerase IV
MKIILHIDFDSFFASAEQQFDPKLRGKPIGVTAQNGRTCIIASSREAKKLGIETGSRTFDALKICPEMTFVKADFNKYYEISKKFLNICKDYSPYVEMFSLDELFLDITKTEHLFDSKYKIIEQIKERIKNEIGEYITVSVGISHNKLLAKLASGLKKPNGVFEINSKNFEGIYSKIPLNKVCGIGDRIAVRLNKLGIYSFPDLRKTPIALLKQEFGNVEADFLKNIAFGLDESPVVPYTEVPEVKSVGRNYCLPKNEYNKRIVLQNIFELCEEVGIKLRRLSKKGRTIGIFIGGYEDLGKRKTFEEYTDSGQEIFERCKVILKDEDFFKTSKYYSRQISIWVGNLEDSENLTLSLFDQTKPPNLLKTIDKINDKFGDHTIRNGFLLYSDKLTTVPNGYFGDTYERTKLANDSNLFFEKQ